MEQIATQLGVSHQTIGRDLSDLSTMDNSKPAKRRANEKPWKQVRKFRTCRNLDL
jgi:IS30 family transposase